MNEIIFTNARYVLDFEGENNVGINVTIDGIDYAIPLEVGNRHYDEIMRQVDAGTLTIAEAE